MAIKNIIARGIGFSPDSVKFIPTHGFGSSAATAAGFFVERIQTYSGGADRMDGYTGGAELAHGYTGGADRMETR